MADVVVFQAAGRALFSLGLVRGSEGNLSTYDGDRLVITRSGVPLRDLTSPDLVVGEMDGPIGEASVDLEVHRRTYRERGPGAIVHAHPPGSVPKDGGGPGEHGVYVFAGSLDEAVREAVRRARAGEEAP